MQDKAPQPGVAFDAAQVLAIHCTAPCTGGTHSDAVEGAIVLREVQPALGVVRAVAPHPNANDVRGAAQQGTA